MKSARTSPAESRTGLPQHQRCPVAKRIRLGDVVEIETHKGLFYAQYTHSNAEYGSLIRVLDGVHEERPGDLEVLVLRPTRYVLFTVLQPAVNRGVFRVIGNCPVPEHARQFPLFRSGWEDPRTGEVSAWWLWDGTTSWKAGTLTEDQMRYPERGIWTDQLVIDRLEDGWNP